MRAETAGFEKASHAYERGRPGYPDAAVDCMLQLAALPPGATVVDLAAGTGKLTRSLVARRLHVIAVEPLREMRERLAEQLPGVRVVPGTAQATGLDPAVAQAVTVAQAFHWFAEEESLAEIARVLEPGGALVLVWNRRDLTDPIQTKISQLTAPYVRDTPSYARGRWKEVMNATSRFRASGEAYFPLTQELDREGIVDRVGSTSYIANLPDGIRHELLARVANLVPEGERVSLPYTTVVYAYARC